MTDIEIARAAKPRKILDIAKDLGLDTEHVEPFGHYKAKVDPAFVPDRPDGKLILVTAINPTPAGINITGIISIRKSAAPST